MEGQQFSFGRLRQLFEFDEASLIECVCRRSANSARESTVPTYGLLLCRHCILRRSCSDNSLRLTRFKIWSVAGCLSRLSTYCGRIWLRPNGLELSRSAALASA